MEEEILEFFKTFRYKTYLISPSKYVILYHSGIELSIKIDNLKIILAFSPKVFNMDDDALKSLKKHLKRKFKLVEQSINWNTFFRSWIEHQFFIQNIKDLNKVIEILDGFLLIDQLS